MEKQKVEGKKITVVECRKLGRKNKNTKIAKTREEKRGTTVKSF